MSSSLKNILVVGASGMVGKHIQAELLARKTCFSRLGALTTATSSSDPKKQAYFTSLEAAGVQVVKADFSDNESLVEAFTGWDVVISTVGMPLVKTQLPLIEAAAKAGVKRFLPSEFGFDPSIPSNAQERVYALKTAVSQKLKEISKAYKDFTYTLVSTGCFAAFPFMVPAAFDIDLENCKIDVIGDGQAPISFTDLRDVAAFTVAILLHAEETQNTIIRIEGTSATWGDVVKLLEEIQGKSYSVTYQSIADAHAKEKQRWAAGDPTAARYALRRIMAQGNAKLSRVQNGLFPEIEGSTNLKAVIHSTLSNKGIV